MLSCFNTALHSHSWSAASLSSHLSSTANAQPSMFIRRAEHQAVEARRSDHIAIMML